MGGSRHTRGGQHQVRAQRIADLFQMGHSCDARLASSGEITNRSLSSVSKRVSSLLIALRTLVSIGVTWISDVFGQFNNATNRLLGSGRSRSSTSSHFHHAAPARVPTVAQMRRRQNDAASNILCVR